MPRVFLDTNIIEGYSVSLSHRITGDVPGRGRRRGPRRPRPAPPRREVHFALESDGWNCTFECKVHVSAFFGVRGCTRRPAPRPAGPVRSPGRHSARSRRPDRSQGPRPSPGPAGRPPILREERRAGSQRTSRRTRPSPPASPSSPTPPRPLPDEKGSTPSDAPGIAFQERDRKTTGGPLRSWRSAPGAV